VQTERAAAGRKGVNSWRVDRNKHGVLTNSGCRSGAVARMCLGVCVEGHQGLSLSPRSEDRSVAMPLECPQVFTDNHKLANTHNPLPSAVSVSFSFSNSLALVT
jgi:hypothetical protein